MTVTDIHIQWLPMYMSFTVSYISRTVIHIVLYAPVFPNFKEFEEHRQMNRFQQSKLYLNFRLIFWGALEVLGAVFGKHFVSLCNDNLSN